MAKKYTLNEAQNFVNRIGTKDLAGILNTFDNFKEVVRTLVNKNDEQDFYKLTDKYLNLINANGGRNLKIGAYELLETLCYDVDNRFKERKGKAVKLFEKYLKKIEIRYNTENYSPEEVYEKINSLSDSLVLRYPNLVSKPKIKWNKDKDAMNFKFKSRGFDVSGNIKLDENELIVYGNIPLAAKLYREEIAEKIKDRLGKALPKLTVSK
ncbi:MAG: hypothetical protein NTZ83_00725 [Candidatus Pacearchaeota archaeon]|nr:hypothetical protein [Candidatus Pacearchaeota archaeon]